MVNAIAALTLGCAALAWLVWRGFFTPVGSFGSWAMFSHIGAYRATLHDDAHDGRPVCPWDYELRQDVFRSAASLQSLVLYLAEEHGMRVVGDGVVLVPFESIRIVVRNGGVVRA
ncbi:hypothetical protein [Streptomyces sp. NPDC049040]|uniref:hypothetical protein n=1 Tax=Streptomyces sp. NPDC049040 TaxID=3365593 RepID=UPI0037133164